MTFGFDLKFGFCYLDFRRMDVLEKFSTHGRRALRDALKISQSCGSQTVELEHLLGGITKQRGSLGAELLAKANVSEGMVLGIATPNQVKLPAAAGPLRMSEPCRHSVEKATLIASLYQHRYIGTEHLLAGVLDQPDGRVERIFRRHGVSRQQLRERLSLIFKSTSKFPELADALEAAHPRDEEAAGIPASVRTAPSALSCVNFM